VIPQPAQKSAIGTGTWLDDRLGAAVGIRRFLNKIFPDHWSFMLGEIALYSFVILIITGIYLALFFDPSLHQVVYEGPYAPLRGQKVSAAYASTVNISLSVRGGLVIRQMHHWAADIFLGAIVIHMCRMFFTGAFRRPRELNWVIGVLMLVLAMTNGFLGYSLPDDLVSGTGLRIMFSFVLSIPIIGSYVAVWLFNGNFPGESFDFRFYILHVLVIPLVLIVLIAVHLGLMIRQKHTQFPGEGRTNSNVVGAPMWPNFAFKTQGFFFMIFGVIALLGGLAQINPIWLYGPYVPYRVTFAVQPDWYMSWIDGALRLMPSWETVFPGHMIPNVFYPAVLIPGITFTLFFLWPWIEDRFTHHSRLGDHNLLDRPRDRPLRTAIGAGTLTFYFILFVATSSDVFSNFFSISLNAVIWSMRMFLVFAPPLVGIATYKICKELAQVPVAGRRKLPSVIIRTPDGRYITVEAEPRPGDQVPELEPAVLSLEQVPHPETEARAGNGGPEAPVVPGRSGDGGPGAGRAGNGGHGAEGASVTTTAREATTAEGGPGRPGSGLSSQGDGGPGAAPSAQSPGPSGIYRAPRDPSLGAPRGPGLLGLLSSLLRRRRQ
jgi:ubiquinol-cytochrome c reductase cytochrome b subunit